MKLTGMMFHADGMDEYDCDIPEAVVTDTKVAFDWRDDGHLLHAILHSSDGTRYEGNFGAPVPKKSCVMEAIRFQAKNGEVLLWVNWHSTETGREGVLLAHLAESWEE